MIVNLILGVIGAFVGGVSLDEEGGALMGFAIGCLTGVLVHLKKRVGDLEKRVKELSLGEQRTTVSRPDPSQRESARTDTASDAAMQPPLTEPPPIPEGHRKAPASGDAIQTDQTLQPEPAAHTAEMQTKQQIPIGKPETMPTASDRAASGGSPESGKQQNVPPHAKAPSAPPKDSKINSLSQAVKNFFTGGNVVVRFGIIILFFGVAFLLKYAAERNVFPLELRLMAVGAGAIVMLALGWRLRSTRPGYALILQGGAVGILYLTLFSSARVYNLIPTPMTFFMLVALTVLSGILAVLQNSLALAAFGTVGGFLAPILTSTGSGSYVMLFSYYGVLNAAIFGIAWFKAWRVLNLIGFFFTFGIGALWGYDQYQPEFFNSVEPFLVIFFLFYVAISVLFAHKQPPHLKGYVDGTLVFGLPIVVFAIQARLVRDWDFGLAYSALTLGIFYIFLASALWRRAVTGMRTLAEAFLSLGVVFGSLAIPLALDGQWTAAAWALEGGALVWVGVRQKRLATRNFGLLLQFGAGFFFLKDYRYVRDVIPVLNGFYLGALCVSVSALFSAWWLERHRDALRKWERWFHYIILTWGLIWWFLSGIFEINKHVTYRNEGPGCLLFIVLSCAFMSWLWKTVQWRAMRLPLTLLLPLLCLLAGGMFWDNPSRHLLTRWNAVPWILGIGTHLYILYQSEKRWSEWKINTWHIGGLLLTVFILTWESGWHLHRIMDRQGVWNFMVWGLLPSLSALFLITKGNLIKWPVGKYAKAYIGNGVMLIGTLLLCWEVLAIQSSGNPAPLPYFPVLNPLDLAQMFTFMIIIQCSRKIRTPDLLDLSAESVRAIYYAVTAAIFLWLNSVVARSVHFWGGVSYSAHSLHRSQIFHAAISILWTLTAFGVMAVAAKKALRPLWFAGGALLGCVVIKLFLVDLSGSGTVARIVSFIAVGCLMLIIGYLSPLPPRQIEEKEDDDKE